MCPTPEGPGGHRRSPAGDPPLAREEGPDAPQTHRRSAFRSVVGNTFWLVLGEFGSRLLAFFTFVHLAPTLLRAGQGMIDLGLTIFSFLSIVSRGGVEIRAVRIAARSRGSLGRLAGITVLLSAAYFLLLFLLLAATSVFFSPTQRQVVLLLAAAAALFPLATRFAFVGREELGIVPISRIAAQGVFLVLCLLAVREPTHVSRVAFFWLGATFLEVAINGAWFRARFGRIRFRIRPSRLWLWVRATFGLSLSRAARLLMTMIDVFALGLLVPEEQLGEYSVANKIPMFAVMTAILVHTPIFPVVSRVIASGDRRRLSAIVADTTWASLGATIPPVLCLALVSEPLLLWLFTGEYQASIPLFEILLWKVPLVALSSLFRTLVWAREPRLDTRLATLGLLASIVAVVLGITWAGTRGAAFGILVGEGVLLVLYAKAAIPSVNPRALLSAQAGLALAAALALVGAVALGTRGMSAERSIGVALLAAPVTAALANLSFARRLWREMRDRN